MQIVFIHGFLGNKNDWDAVIDHLPCKCTAFDLPGHGSSPIDFDLYGAMRELGEFHLVGYSMGGRVALQYPGKVLSLTLISTHMGLPEEERLPRLIVDQKVADQILSLPIDQFLEQWYNQPLFGSLREKLDICALRKTQDKEGLAEAIMKYSLGLQNEFWERESLRLIGELDQKYRELYRDRPHKIIQAAGHAIHLEKPEVVAREIYEYVRSV